MNETDAVSCLLCLQADEYGSMIKVCVPPGRIPPATEKVICRLCAGIIASVLDSGDGEETFYEPVVQPVGVRAEHPGADPVPSDRAGWDSNLPDRTLESAVEEDRADAQIATDSSKE